METELQEPGGVGEPSPELIAPAPSEMSIAQVAQGIRDLHRLHGLRLVFDVGRLVVDELYAGHSAAVHRRGPKDSPLSRLAAQPDLPFSRSQLSRAVALYEALAPLGDVATRQHLSASHVRVVLPLPSPKQEEYLRKAESEQWSVRQLEAQTQGAEGKRRGGGRPPLPRFVRSIHALEKYVAEPDDVFGDLEAIEGLEAEEAQRLYQTVTGMKLRCEELQKALRDRVPGFTG